MSNMPTPKYCAVLFLYSYIIVIILIVAAIIAVWASQCVL